MHLTCSSLATVIVVSLWGEGYTAFATVVTTLIVFLFSEMLPKSYANANSEKVALAFFGFAFRADENPDAGVFLFVKISDLFSKLFGGGADERLTEEELETIIDTVEKSGSLDEEQTDLLQNAVDFTKTPVRDVMTMREDIAGVDIRLPAEEIFDIVKNTGFSRLLVYDGDLDAVVGVLSVREYLRAWLRRGRVNLRRIVIDPHFAAPDEAIDDLFAVMSRGRRQFAVIREAEKTVGIATIEDFLEELVGEIWDEYDVYDKKFYQAWRKLF